ncbi:trigger factor [Candidatus Falkowbacteria bacterium]|nr:trigger factor [Candidatus Falkowbacteria bacterium]
MKVEKKELEKSQVELIVELSLDEFKPYLEKGAEELSKEVKIDGFRPGKVPFDVLKSKVGEMSILERAARVAINKNFEKIIKENLSEEQPVGQPMVDITKLAPDNPVEFKITIALLPKITLGEYKDLKIKPETFKIEEKDIDKTLETIRESRASEKVVDREAKEGDKVVIDLEMFLDKVPLEGGQSKGMAVLLGKEYFIPGFDKQIAGLKKGETKEFSLPYPKDFHQKNLAGKMVEFKVKIVDVFERSVPEANDELAKTFGMETLADIKRNIKESMEQEKKQEAERKTEGKIIEEILKKSSFSDIADILIDNEIETMLNEMESNIASRGGKMEDYLASIKKTRNELKLEFAPQAVKRIKSALLIREIGNKEKIEVSEKDIDEKRDELLKQYKGYQKVEDRVKSPEYRGTLHNILSNQKVVDKLKDWNLSK